MQLSCPPGGEERARRFYVDGLGLDEVAKPAALAGRGGVWFRHPEGAEIHLGIEEPVTGRKAHPALEVTSSSELEAVAARLVDCGFEVDWSQRHNAEWFERFHTHDPFGNRIEVVHVLEAT